MYCMVSSSGVVDDSTTNGLARIRHPRQQFQGARLVEELVQVSALRALDAGGTAALARAARQQLDGVGDPALELVEAARRDSDSTGVAVVDADRRRGRAEVEVRREAADVPAVAHRPQRQQRDERVLGRMEGREQQ